MTTLEIDSPLNFPLCDSIRFVGEKKGLATSGYSVILFSERTEPLGFNMSKMDRGENEITPKQVSSSEAVVDIESAIQHLIHKGENFDAVDDLLAVIDFLNNSGGVLALCDAIDASDSSAQLALMYVLEVLVDSDREGYRRTHQDILLVKRRTSKHYDPVLCDQECEDPFEMSIEQKVSISAKAILEYLHEFF